MRAVRLRSCLGVAFFMMVSFSAVAQSNINSLTSEPLQRLKAMQRAAESLNYSGTFVYQQASRIRTSRITHINDDGQVREKLEILDGVPREYVRENDEVACYIPHIKTVQFERRSPRDVFPAIINAEIDSLDKSYRMRVGGRSRIAGRDCQAMILTPKDKLRYGYKLWTDVDSGLLVRLETLDHSGETVEQISFTDLAIGNIDKQRTLTSFTNIDGWRIERQTQAVAAAISPWIFKTLPDGFEKIGEVSRVVGAPSVLDGVAAPPEREVRQVLFSDGMAAISVFIEPASDAHFEGSLQQGALTILGKRYDDFWITGVGEVPSRTVQKIVDSIEYSPK